MAFGFNWENTLEEAEIAPGTVGLLIDETPPLTHADIRPFIWSVALARGAVKPSEILGCVTLICGVEDLKSGFCDEVEDDRSRAEWLIDEIIGDMTASGLLEYNEEKDHWTLHRGDNDRNLPAIIKAVAGVGGSLPKHLILEGHAKTFK